jgi:hypothetical protein
MKEFHCPHCGQSTFTTLCTDCQAEGIRIDETRAVFHLGRCHRCGHVDDEPCSKRIGANPVMANAKQKKGGALRDITQMAFRLASRAAEAIRSSSIRTR